MPLENGFYYFSFAAIIVVLYLLHYLFSKLLEERENAKMLFQERRNINKEIGSLYSAHASGHLEDRVYARELRKLHDKLVDVNERISRFERLKAARDTASF